MKNTKNVRLQSDLLIEKKLIEWTIKICDALFIHNMHPAVGSVVYCNLGLVAEYSGIYVGRNKIVHLSGDGHIEKVSAKEFCEHFSGLNPSFTVFCPAKSNCKEKGDKKGRRIYHRFSKEGFKRSNEYLLGLGLEIKACFFGIATIYSIKRFVISLLTLLDSSRIVFGLEQSFYNLLLDS